MIGKVRRKLLVHKSGFSFYPMFWGLNWNLAALSQFRSPEVYSIHSHQEAAVVKIRVHFGVGQYIFPESGMLNSYGRKGNLQARQRWSPESTVGVDRVKDYSTELGWDLKKKTCYPQISNMRKFYMGIGSFSTLRHPIALPHLTTSALELSYGLIKLHRLSYYKLKYPTFANKIFLLRNLLWDKENSILYSDHQWSG